MKRRKIGNGDKVSCKKTNRGHACLGEPALCSTRLLCWRLSVQLVGDCEAAMQGLDEGSKLRHILDGDTEILPFPFSRPEATV